MTAKKELFGAYFVKKIIIEVRHKPNLLHNERVPQILNDMMVDFNKVTIINEPGNKIYKILNDDEYFSFNSSWKNVSTTSENVTNFESACKNSQKNIASYLTKLKISSITRLGFRTSFLLPFNGDFTELVSYFKDKFYNNLSSYELFGTLEDVGIVALTINDKNFKGNLSLGPMTKNEVKDKIAEFKNYDKDFEASLLIDLDLYNDTSPLQSINTFIENAYNASRIKIIKFREHLNN